MYPQLVLTSTSKFRQESLKRLGIDFECLDSKVIEEQRENESAILLATRLAKDKAKAGSLLKPDAIVIGADQVLEANNKIYGKPGNLKTARENLQELSDSQGVFHSAMFVIYGSKFKAVCVETHASWRKLTDDQIDSYLAKEPAIHSAGAAQLECLGISLLKSLTSDDPSAILGLPLISLCTTLEDFGLPVLVRS